MGNIKAGDDMFFTATMAEVLEGQGHYEDALMIYKILADTSPWDQSLIFRIERLKGLAERGRKKPRQDAN
ncbi:MAG TPA: hypothetical protein DDW94_00500 [Deltaproteobacteria bacterium]|nr:MAG: hypothetical protein A2Z79_05865 [Deltaproteobacteria bacterium GWA2_55_82]OGQ62373.1 MAG: hypothetical protein A3I81_01180 [Deltaproteobacteria bacterium RIFCSPLOWO2_02_FULL_55_12]OIJ73285.1 MAG: hypothetical protein A2V21_302795 [Deltaproteobacteria bacterium GWC2_55_46]HBG45448.1 hypothetical protein [Deltaproteobacteria bacterium]HCY10279.1 hypothetical protein [Deltaproteobacteria bacterium]